MDKDLKRLAFIILDIIAIIAILGIVLLDDLTRGYEKSEFQKLITGEAHWGSEQACEAIRCREPVMTAELEGTTPDGQQICRCPEGTAFKIAKYTPETVLNNP